MCSARQGNLPPDLASELRHFRGTIRFRDVLSLGYLKDGKYSLGSVRIALDAAGDFRAGSLPASRWAKVPGILECRPMRT
jgi:hypothetical protein